MDKYIYGMEIKDDEIKEKVNGVKMSKIGLIKKKKLKCENIFIKSLYNILLWIKLSKYMKERFERRKKYELEQMDHNFKINLGNENRGF
jgi:hypothetical protein